MTPKEKKKLQSEFRRRWHYLTKIKEGGKAWEREMQRLEEIREILFPSSEALKQI